MTGRPVYSTRAGRLCSRCGKARTICICHVRPAAPKGDGVVRVSCETKGRKGKGVTRVLGVPLDPEALGALAKELRVQCGSGGTVKDGAIELQGDHREPVIAALVARGLKVKRVGGP